MDRRRLSIYLNDHLAAADAALARARASVRSNRGSELGEALEGFVRDASEDREALLEILRDLGLDRNLVKELAALAAERVGRLKLNGRLIHYSPLSRLEEFELFAAGASAKASLWETLQLLGDHEPRLDSAELARLHERARAQSQALSDLRRQQIHDAFS
jgi:hypothetical protein